MASDAPHRAASTCASLAAAALYAGVSVIMVLSNKALLSSWRFDFTASLLLLQNALTLTVLLLMRRCAATGPSDELALAFAFPAWDRAVARRTAPLALAYLANVGCGLAALRLASVPVYQVLKRLAPLPAMLLDSLMRGATFSLPVRSSIFLVAGGAVLTGAGDADFDGAAYALALASCVLQALYLVLTSQARDLGLSALGVLHYNALLSLPVLLLGAAAEAPRLLAYAHWAEPRFVALLLANVALGGALSFLLFLCTQLNSAVTTLIVGNIKALLTTALGFFLFGRVRLSAAGLAGVAVNSLGGVLYSVAKFVEHRRPPPKALARDGSGAELKDAATLEREPLRRREGSSPD